MKYFVVSKIWEGEREKGIALTELKSKSKAMNKLGNVWLGASKNEKSEEKGSKHVSGYDFAIFVVEDDSITAKDLLRNEELVKCLKNLAKWVENEPQD